MTVVNLLLTVLVLGVIVIAVTVVVGALAGGAMRGASLAAVAWMKTALHPFNIACSLAPRLCQRRAVFLLREREVVHTSLLFRLLKSAIAIRSLP